MVLEHVLDCHFMFGDIILTEGLILNIPDILDATDMSLGLETKLFSVAHDERGASSQAMETGVVE
jgi:hypothetical protein